MIQGVMSWRSGSSYSRVALFIFCVGYGVTLLHPNANSGRAFSICCFVNAFALDAFQFDVNACVFRCAIWTEVLVRCVSFRTYGTGVKGLGVPLPLISKSLAFGASVCGASWDVGAGFVDLASSFFLFLFYLLYSSFFVWAITIELCSLFCLLSECVMYLGFVTIFLPVFPNSVPRFRSVIPSTVSGLFFVLIQQMVRL